MKIACLFFLALGLIAVVALIVFGHDAVVTFIGKFALIIAIFVLPIVLGGLLVGLGHRWLTKQISKGH